MAALKAKEEQEQMQGGVSEEDAAAAAAAAGVESSSDKLPIGVLSTLHHLKPYIKKNQSECKVENVDF